MATGRRARSCRHRRGRSRDRPGAGASRWARATRRHSWSATLFTLTLRMWTEEASRNERTHGTTGRRVGGARVRCGGEGLKGPRRHDHRAAGPPHPRTGPSHPRTGPSHPRTGPSHPRTGPSHPRTGPSHPRTGRSHPRSIGPYRQLLQREGHFDLDRDTRRLAASRTRLPCPQLERFDCLLIET